AVRRAEPARHEPIVAPRRWDRVGRPGDSRTPSRGRIVPPSRGYSERRRGKSDPSPEPPGAGTLPFLVKNGRSKPAGSQDRGCPREMISAAVGSLVGAGAPVVRAGCAG